MKEHYTLEEAAMMLHTSELNIRKKIICDAIDYIHGAGGKFLGFHLEHLDPYLGRGQNV